MLCISFGHSQTLAMSPEEDFVPHWRYSPANRRGLDERRYWWSDQARVAPQHHCDKERTDKIAQEHYGMGIYDRPPRYSAKDDMSWDSKVRSISCSPSLERRDEKEHHVGSEKLRASEHNHAQTNWEDETLRETEKTRLDMMDQSHSQAISGQRAYIVAIGTRRASNDT